MKTQFIVDNPPFLSSHASTIVETKDGLLAGWFGGREERNPDVSIYLSDYRSNQWSPPREVANGVETPKKRYPCWNPVLFQPKAGPLLLFYKVGPSPEGWWGMLMTSPDQGVSWSKPVRLPPDIVGPVRNKPVELPNGLLLCGSSSEDHGWIVHMEWSPDLGKSWQRTKGLNSRKEVEAIQPTLLVHPSGKIQILCRSKQKQIFEAWSEDQGKTWSRLGPISLPNPNSAIDAVMLKRGGVALIYNHTRQGRSTIHAALSSDGIHWQPPIALESGPGEYSYPAVIQTSDGLLHVTYTWRRERIRHLILDPQKIQAQAALSRD